MSAPEVNASASPTAVRLGGRFTLFITAVYSQGVEPNLPEPLELGPGFEVRKKISEDRSRADGKVTREWQIEVLAWELGDLRIPISIGYTFQGQFGRLEANVVRIRVDGVLGDVVDDPKALRDLQPPTSLISRDWFWMWVSGGGAAAIIVTGFVLWLRERRRRQAIVLTGGAVARPRRMDMTSARALEALLAIEKSGVLSRDDDRRRGYTEMVDVIRDYIGSRYHVATRDLTSSELSRRLKRYAPDDERALIDSWLDKCDLVKYGGLETSTLEATVVLDDARALIVTTTELREAAAKAAA